MACFFPPNAKVYFCHNGKLLRANRGLKFAVDFENGMRVKCPYFLGRFLLLLLRIRSAHLGILGFPMGGAY